MREFSSSRAWLWASLSPLFMAWRAERSRNRHTGGSGLGLAIVRKIVEAHGGAVAVTSVPGESTVFTTRLPAPPRDAGGHHHPA